MFPYFLNDLVYLASSLWETSSRASRTTSLCAAVSWVRPTSLDKTDVVGPFTTSVKKATPATKKRIRSRVFCFKKKKSSRYSR